MEITLASISPAMRTGAVGTCTTMVRTVPSRSVTCVSTGDTGGARGVLETMGVRTVPEGSIPELRDPWLNPPYKNRNVQKWAMRARHAIRGSGGCRCYICGRGLTIDTMTIDHVIPRSKGGGNTFDNLMACCLGCNQEKGNMPWDYFRMLRALVIGAGDYHFVEMTRFVKVGRPGQKCVRMTRVQRDVFNRFCLREPSV